MDKESQERNNFRKYMGNLKIGIKEIRENLIFETFRFGREN